MLAYAGIVVLAWAVFVVVAICLAKIAARPTPKPPEKPVLIALDDVSFEWPHPWSPQEIAETCYRNGFRAGESAEWMRREWPR